MKPRTIRIWSWLHRWTSLACTLFALLLCLTGLPLIFHEELEPTPVVAKGEQPAGSSLDAMMERALARQPGQVIPYLFFEPAQHLVKVPTAESMTTDPGAFRYQVFDTRTGARLEVSQPNEGFLYVMLRLHADLFAGPWGMYFLGFMGLLLFVALASGVGLYGPFTRSLPFGTIRERPRKLRWLDLHNLLGIGTAAWLGIVIFTGAINTLAMPIEMAWQSSQLVEMAQHGQLGPASTDRVSLDTIVAAVRKTEPNMTVTTIAFPGTPFSSGNHIAIFLTGNSPLTSRILKPALADARTGEIVAVRDMPWYATALFMSQPLHFGDYGGLALKVAWAMMDVIAIVILGSGIYLWIVRQRRIRGDGPPKDAGDRPCVGRARLSRWEQWKLPLSLALLTIVGLVVSLIWEALWVAAASVTLAIVVGVMILSAAKRHRPENYK